MSKSYIGTSDVPVWVAQIYDYTVTVVVGHGKVGAAFCSPKDRVLGLWDRAKGEDLAYARTTGDVGIVYDGPDVDVPKTVLNMWHTCPGMLPDRLRRRLQATAEKVLAPRKPKGRKKVPVASVESAVKEKCRGE